MGLDLDAFFNGLHDPDDWSGQTADVIVAQRRSVEGRSVEGQGPDPTRTVSELVIDRPTVIYGSPAHRILMVAGDIRCRAMELVRSYLFTAGTLTADECVFVCAHGISQCVGGCETQLWLQDTWDNVDAEQEPVDNIRAPHIYVRDTHVTASRKWDTAALKQVVSPAAFRRDDDGEFDPFFLIAVVAGGTAALRRHPDQGEPSAA